MNRTAPTLSVSGIRQSRRLQGQFSHDVDRQCYVEVLLAVPIGAASQPAGLRAICKAITAFQRDRERGSYDLRLIVYGAVPPSSNQICLGYKSTAGSLLRWLTDHAGADAAGPHSLDELPKPHRGGLLVIVQAHDGDAVSEEVLAVLAGHPGGQIVWVRLHEERFYTGRELPPQSTCGVPQ